MSPLDTTTSTSLLEGTNGHIALPDFAVEHRAELHAYVLEHAEGWHREALQRLYRQWDNDNVAHFAATLVPPYILLNEPSGTQSYGDCKLHSGFGGRSQIRIRPSLLTGTHPHMEHGSGDAEGLIRFAADVLLHESIHLYEQEIGGHREESYHGHGPIFRDHCNRIGAILGLPPVRTEKKRGPDRDLPSCTKWPHCVRPVDYYRGAFAPPAPEPETEEPWPYDPATLAHVILHDYDEIDRLALWQTLQTIVFTTADLLAPSEAWLLASLDHVPSSGDEDEGHADV